MAHFAFARTLHGASDCDGDGSAVDNGLCMLLLVGPFSCIGLLFLRHVFPSARALPCYKALVPLAATSLLAQSLTLMGSGSLLPFMLCPPSAALRPRMFGLVPRSAADSAKIQGQLRGAAPGARCGHGGDLSPMDFGAVGDGVANDTEAVLAAIEACALCHCRSLVIGPGGREHLVQPGALEVRLPRFTLIRFEGFLVGPTIDVWNPKEQAWPKGSCAYGEVGCAAADGASPELARSQWSLLHLVDSTDVSIEGPGGLRGAGDGFWKARDKKPQIRGYCLVKVQNCTGIRMSGLTLRDSPMYQLVLVHSQMVRLDGLTVTLSKKVKGNGAPKNTDGVNIFGSRDIVLRDSHIESGDDNIVIKEDTHDVWGQNLSLEFGKGISIGSLGESMHGNQVVTNVTFTNVRLRHSMHGARIKTWKGSVGLVRNVSFEDFLLEDVGVGILIDQSYCPHSQRPEGCSDDPDQLGGAIMLIENVTYNRFEYRGGQDMRIDCVHCYDVRLDGDIVAGSDSRAYDLVA